MNQTVAAPSLSQRIEDNAVLIFITGLICFLGYVCLKDSGPGLLAFLGAFVGAGFFFITGLYRGLLKPELALYVLTAYLPFSNELRFIVGKGLNLINLLVVIIAFFWFKYRDKSKPILLKTPLNVPLFIFLALGLISVFRGAGYGMGFLLNAGIEYYRVWGVPAFLYFLVVNAGYNETVIKNLIKIMMMVTIIIGLMSIYQYLDGDDRVYGVMNQPNQLAAFFNYYMFLFFAFFLMNPRTNWFHLIFFLITFRGIMVTFSRAGYLAFVAGLYTIICFRSRLLLILLVLGTALLFVNPALIPEGIRYRMGQTFEKPNVKYLENGQVDTSSLDPSVGNRIKVWHGAMAMIKEHPMFGVGFYMFEKKILHYWTGWLAHDPHNSYLLIAAEMGIPTLLVFCWIIWLIFWSSQKLYRKSGDPFIKTISLGMIAGVPSLLVSNIYGCRLNSVEVTSYFWMLSGIIVRWNMLEGEKLKNVE